MQEREMASRNASSLNSSNMSLLVSPADIATVAKKVDSLPLPELENPDWIVLKATDAERERIGADLHDGLGQQLAGISCIATALAKRSRGLQPDMAEMASLLSRLALEAITQAQALARGLCPVTIEDHGLVPAVDELLEQCRKIHRVDCRLSVRGPDPEIETARALQVYRIIQESINNACRHGGAQRIRVGIFIRPTRVRVAILDDGEGFDTTLGKSSHHGRGLRLMHRRAKLAGAVLALHSRPGWGTRVICTLSPS